MSCPTGCAQTNSVDIEIQPTSGTQVGSWTFSTDCVSVPYGENAWAITYSLPTGSTWSFKAVSLNSTSPSTGEVSPLVTITETIQDPRDVPGGLCSVTVLSGQTLTIEFTNANISKDNITFGVYLTVAAPGYSDQTSMDPQVVLERQD